MVMNHDVMIPETGAYGFLEKFVWYMKRYLPYRQERIQVSYKFKT